MNALHIICKLVRMAVLGSEEDIPACIDWTMVLACAEAQGVGAICYDVATHLPALVRPEPSILLHSVQNVEQACDNFRHRHAVTQELRAILGENRLRLLFLGGECLAENYPKPELREAGDVDMMVPFGTRESNRIFASLGLSMDFQPQQTKFSYKDVLFLNHSLGWMEGRKNRSRNRIVSMVKFSLFSTIEREDGCLELEPVMQAILLVWRASQLADKGDKVTLQMLLDLVLLIRKYPYITMAWGGRLRYAGLDRIADSMLCASDALLDTGFRDDWGRSTKRRTYRLIRKNLVQGH